MVGEINQEIGINTHTHTHTHIYIYIHTTIYKIINKGLLYSTGNSIQYSYNVLEKNLKK